jgi:two-component system, OmpR family, sensor histidine kinase CreC
MHLGLRLFFAFFTLTGLTAYFVLRLVVAEVQPAVRQVVEEVLIDTAHLVAEWSTDTLRQPGASAATVAQSGLAQRLQAYALREVDAQIWGMPKRSLDLRIYLTDAKGQVLLDTGSPSAVGQDYSAWNDVARTLQGRYGARSTRTRYSDDGSLVMFVAAPIYGPQGEVIGSATVAKPSQAVQRFIERSQRRLLEQGLALLAASVLIGAAVTWWLVHSVRRLRHYASQAQAGTPLAAPPLPGELGELARAIDTMRERVEGRSQWEHRVRALTHELKSPLTALRGAGELLQEPLPEADRQRFAAQVLGQTERLQTLVEQLLALSKLESQRQPSQAQPLRMDSLLREVAAERGVSFADSTSWPAVTVLGDREALALALHNVLGNALDFAPPGAPLEVHWQQRDGQVRLSLRDHGPGVPPAALPRLGEQFFSTPRPDGRKGSGLGLAIALQVAALHGGTLQFEHAQPGLCVHFTLPSHNASGAHTRA